jgi:hypothetical protein
MEDVGIFYIALVDFTAIWYILWPFGIFYGHLVYFMAIWYLHFMVIWYFFPKFWNAVSRKFWQPCTSQS